MRTTTLLATLLLAAAIPAASQTLDYRTLCGATEGTGDNNDFCALWAQGNHQGMRNALSIAIRTARAAENRNRYYFDHKRGAERGAFIQLKRPWMGEDWQVLRQTSPENTDEIWVFNWDYTFWIELKPFYSELVLEDANALGGETGYGLRMRVYGYRTPGFGGGAQRDSDSVRRAVECKLDDYGWQIGVNNVAVRPDC